MSQQAIQPQQSSQPMESVGNVQSGMQSQHGFSQQPVGGMASQPMGQQQGGMVQTQAAVSEVQPQEFPTRTFLTDQQRRTSIQTLNRILADSVVLLSQARYAHWNVRGPQFFQLHELFEDLAELLEDQIDEIAERITSLGGQARGTVHQVAPKSQVKRIPPSVVQGMEFVEVLADSIAVYDATLTQAIYTANDVEDLDTADLLNELSREIGKYLWFLEAHLPIQAVGSQMGGSQQQQI